MTAIPAVMTDVGRNKLTEHLAGLLSSMSLIYFKIGEGGFQNIGGTDVPKTPSPLLTRLDADGTALTGVLTFTNLVTTVTGSVDAKFLTEVAAGDYIRLDAHLVWVEVSSVTDDRHLELSAGYAGATVSGSGSVIVIPWYVFKKSFVSADLTVEGNGRISAVAFLDFIEGNDDGFGGNPKYFEVGLFDANNNMLAYGTYAGVEKTNAIQLNRVVRISFTRA